MMKTNKKINAIILLKTFVFKLLILVLFLFSGSCVQTKQVTSTSTDTKIGLIKDQKTAIKIAEVIWFSVYGDMIYESKPFKAKLIKNNTVWLVEGTLNFDRGGIPFIEFQRKDCKVIRFGHSK